jgi:hypothetical protein
LSMVVWCGVVWCGVWCCECVQTRWGHVDPAAWNELDGFSTIAPMLFGFSKTAANDTLIPYDNIGLYALANATTVLVNAATGQRVPHWTERDAFDLTFGRSRPPLLILQARVCMGGFALLS